MYRNILTLVILFAYTSCLHAAHGTTVYFIDRSETPAFRAQTSDVQLTPASLSLLVSSVLGHPPLLDLLPTHVDQVDALLHPNPFARPQVYALAYIAGLDSDAARLFVGEAASAASLQLHGDDVSDGDDSRASSSWVLAPWLLQGCGGKCMEDFLAQHSSALHIDYSSNDSAPLTGSITIEGHDGGDAATLQLSNAATKDWVADVIALRLLAEQLAADDAFIAHAQQGGQLVELYASSLRAVRDAYGASSSEYRAASWCMGRIVHDIMDLLSHKAAVHAAYQVMAVPDMEASALKGLVGLNQQLSSRRRLLQAAAPSPSDQPVVDTEKAFVDQAVAIGVFIALLYLLAAAVYCLCNMELERDTLLYSKAKVE